MQQTLYLLIGFMVMGAIMAIVMGIRSRHVGGDQRLHPVAHFARGFVGEGHGQDGPAGDPMGGHQVRHPVGDDPGFPASSARQHQQRAFNVSHGLLLAGIEAF